MEESQPDNRDDGGMNHSPSTPEEKDLLECLFATVVNNCHNRINDPINRSDESMRETLMHYGLVKEDKVPIEGLFGRTVTRYAIDWNRAMELHIL